MADIGAYNKVASDYQKRLQDPDWKVGKKKDVEAFSKGATQSGTLVDPGVKQGITSRLKKAWKALTD